MKKKVLVTGGSGLFAVNCAMQLRDTHDVVLGLHKRTISIRGVQARQVELDSVESALKMIEEIDPDCVIHTVAVSSVEQCEADPATARLVNASLASVVARACEQLQKKMVHISTDHLFAGTSAFSSEDTPLSPLNVYAASKAEADRQVLAANPQSLVIRTNFFGWGTPYRKSFSDQILATLWSGNRPNLFTDVFFTPVIIESLVQAIVDLIERGQSGIFNVVGDERLSKYEFGILLAEGFGLDPALVRPIRFSGVDKLVTRPKDMSLSNLKVTQTLRRSIGRVKDHLLMLREQQDVGIRDELGGVGLN